MSPGTVQWGVRVTGPDVEGGGYTSPSLGEEQARLWFDTYAEADLGDREGWTIELVRRVLPDWDTVESVTK